MSAIDEKIVFAVSPAGQGDGAPVVVLGVPKDAWEYMRDGKTHTFDLTKAGIPIKLVLFGAESHDAAMKMLNAGFAAEGRAYIDARNKDFSIEPKGGR